MKKCCFVETDNRLLIVSRFELENVSLKRQLTWQWTRNSKLSAENASLRSSLEEMLEEIEKTELLRLKQSQARLSTEIARYEELFSKANEKLEKKVQTGKQCHEEPFNAENDNKSSDKALTDRIQRLERHNLELQNENGRLKNQMALDKQHHVEFVLSSNHTIEEQKGRHTQLLEEYRLQLQSAAADNRTIMVSQLKSENMLLKGQLTMQCTQNSQLGTENERLHNRVNDLEKELSGKNTELLADVDRLLSGVEYKNPRQSSEEGYGQLEDVLCERIKALEKQVSEDRARYTAHLDLWQQEILSLRDRVELKDAEMKKIKEDERQRALVLQEAMLRYLRQPLSV